MLIRLTSSHQTRAISIYPGANPPMWVILGSGTGNWLSHAREIIKIPRLDRLTNDAIDVCLKVAGRADRHGGNTIGPHRTSGQVRRAP